MCSSFVAKAYCCNVPVHVAAPPNPLRFSESFKFTSAFPECLSQVRKRRCPFPTCQPPVSYACLLSPDMQKFDLLIDVDSMVRQLDRDDNGSIDYHEFSRLFDTPEDVRVAAV